MLVGATTGIAALNVEGKTLHSLCQLPPVGVVADDIKDMRIWREMQVTCANAIFTIRGWRVNAGKLIGKLDGS